MSLFDKIKQVDDKARDMGFEWPNALMIIDQATSECDEMRSCILENESVSRLQEETGDLLLTALQFCFFHQWQPEDILSLAQEKFHRRLRCLKSLMKQNNIPTLKGKDVQTQLSLWKKAKEKESKNF